MSLAAIVAINGCRLAMSSARDQLEALRPSGPVTVKADRVDWVQDSAMKYGVNVVCPRRRAAAAPVRKMAKRSR